MHCSCQYNYFESRIYRKAVCSMIPRTLVAASSRPLVLSILSQKDSYGYEIIQHVKQLTGGSMDWKDGMLYPVLQRLEHDGLIGSYWGQSEVGRKRRYYRLTPKGIEALKKEKQQWLDVHTALSKLWGPGPCLT